MLLSPFSYSLVSFLLTTFLLSHLLVLFLLSPPPSSLTIARPHSYSPACCVAGDERQRADCQRLCRAYSTSSSSPSPTTPRPCNPHLNAGHDPSLTFTSELTMPAALTLALSSALTLTPAPTTPWSAPSRPCRCWSCRARPQPDPQAVAPPLPSTHHPQPST